MAIKVNFEENISSQYKYADLHLDLEAERIPLDSKGNLLKSKVNNDFRTDLDEHAIKNSLINLFNTRPRQRLLNPNFGIDLFQFVFEPANEVTARIIGRTISNGLKLYESRVVLEKLNIKINAEDNEYQINMLVVIPSLSKKKVVFTGILNQNGFAI